MSAIISAIANAVRHPLKVYKEHRIQVRRREATEEEFFIWLLDKRYVTTDRMREALMGCQEAYIMALKKTYWNEFIQSEKAFWEKYEIDDHTGC